MFSSFVEDGEELEVLDSKIFRTATKLTKRGCKGFHFVEIGDGPDLYDLAHKDWSQHSTIKKSYGEYKN